MPTTICASSPAAARRLPLREVPTTLDLGQMIVSCPVCRTRYQVNESALRGQSGRTVRCAKCGHTWHQTASPEPPEGGDEAKTDGRIEPALEVPPRPAATLEVPPRQRALPERPRRRSRWGALRWLVIALLLAVAGGVCGGDRRRPRCGCGALAAGGTALCFGRILGRVAGSRAQNREARPLAHPGRPAHRGRYRQ